MSPGSINQDRGYIGVLTSLRPLVGGQGYPPHPDQEDAMTIRWDALPRKTQKPGQQTNQPTRPQVSAWSAPPINATSLHYPYLDRMAVVSEAIAQGQAGQVYLDNTWWRARCQQPLELPAGTVVAPGPGQFSEPGLCRGI